MIITSIELGNNITLDHLRIMLVKMMKKWNQPIHLKKYIFTGDYMGQKHRVPLTGRKLNGGSEAMGSYFLVTPTITTLFVRNG